MEQLNQEICSIRIMFPVQSDEQALDCKKKIQTALGDIENVNIQFSITNMPPTGGLPPR